MAAQEKPLVAPAESRADPRHRVRLWAAIGGEVLDADVVVLDISAHGFRVACKADLEAGMTVQLTIGGQPPRSARVIHVTPEWSGCAFTPPLTPDDFSALISTGPFATARPADAPEPEVALWPVWVRLSVLLLPTAAFWLAVGAALL